MSTFSNRFREIPEYLQSITPEQSRQARNTNLVDFLSGRGENLKRESNSGHFSLRDHDSLIIKDSFFWWNSRGIEGNAVDFMMQYYGMDFKTAVIELTNIVPQETKKRLASATNTVQVSKEFSLPAINRDMRRTFAYLTKTRLVDKSIIQNLTKEKLLMQTQDLNNILFPWYDENGKIVGAELCGTLDQRRYKGIVEGSQYGYGYNIKIGKPKRLCFFESAIDLLSFWTIYKNTLTDSLLISMAGIKEEVIEGFLKRHSDLSDVYLGVDNDNGGNEFIKSLQDKITANSMQPPKTKDWNDYLKYKNQKIN